MEKEPETCEHCGVDLLEDEEDACVICKDAIGGDTYYTSGQGWMLEDNT